ncbi:hypothetical protein [Nocardia transvalensis]|uniref:hypothetical protein n=1 Tax=Nocardia transvalensis TaxID=37333 RepID=UPI001894DF59|nr:hypothetical protein [Nocardia transvalensis]MBF6331453.1 hypothetical protein [Nocardia transvalensis]
MVEFDGNDNPAHKSVRGEKPKSLENHISFGYLFNTTARESRFPPIEFERPPAMSDSRIERFRCATTPIDARGRAADRSVIRELGWQPGQPISISLEGPEVVVRAMLTSKQRISPSGYLYLPAAARHAWGIRAGDRVLLAGGSDRGVLVVYSMAAVAAALSRLSPGTWPPS